MMKYLVLMRHAKSDWSVAGQKDFDRELNTRGHRDAPRMGARLSLEKQFQPEIVISSPAQRAAITAKYVCEQIKFPEDGIIYDEDIYEASLRTLLRVVNELDDKFHSALLFGHNPGLTYFAEYLTKREINEIPTSGIICIKFEIDSWSLVSEGNGFLDWFIFPKDTQEQ